MSDYLPERARTSGPRRATERWMRARGPEVRSVGRVAPLSRVVDEPVLNPDALAMLRALQSERTPNLLAELIDLFLDDAPHVLAALQAAVAASDTAMVRQLAHRLKGSSANFGATALVAVCEELEMLGRSGVIRGASERLVRLMHEYGRVTVALQLEKAA